MILCKNIKKTKFKGKYSPGKQKTKEKPINDHLIKLFDIAGFLLIAKIKEPKITPTPIATPTRLIDGILEAKCLNPIETKH